MKVGPVSLAAPGSDPCPIGSVGVIAGWGVTSYPSTVQPAMLETANVSVASCSGYEATGQTITPRMLCAGEPGTGPCHGDSGGAFYV